ncbi:unnamed protein product [Penicillium pancosmium]
MYSKDKPRYSRTVSRIAAGEYDAYQERISAESLGCLLSDHAQQSLIQERMAEIETIQRVMQREKHYFEFRHKKARRFDCDNPEDSDTEYALFPTNNNEVWGSGVNTDISINTPPYGIPYDSEQPFGSPDRPDERMTSTPVTPVQVHKYPHPVHKAVSSMSGNLGLDLCSHKEDTSETTSIAEQPPTVEISPPTLPLDATVPKKKKKKAKRKPRHTGKKAKARAAAAAAVAEHGVSSEKSDDNKNTVVQAEDISASYDIANRIEAKLPEKPVTFTPSSSSVPDKDSLNSRPPSSEIDFLTAAKHDLARLGLGITLAIDREGNENQTSQHMNKFDNTTVVEIPKEAWELQEACFADDEQTPEDIAPIWDGYQSRVGERHTQTTFTTHREVLIPSSPHRSSLSLSSLPHPPLPHPSSDRDSSLNSSISDFVDIRTMAGSAAKQKQAGRPQPAIPLSSPRSSPSSSPPLSKASISDAELTPPVSALMELSRKSRSGTGSRSSQSAPANSPSPPVVVDISMSTQSTVMPQPRDENTLDSISNTPSNGATPTSSSNQTIALLNVPTHSFTERKSWADVLRLPPDSDATIESAMKSPSEYFDAKQSPRSSPETSGPSSKKSTPPNNKNQASTQLTAAHFRSEPNTSSPSPTCARNSWTRPSGESSASSKSSGKRAKFTKLRKGVVISPSPSSNTPRGKKNKSSWRKPQVSDPVPSADSSHTVLPEKDEKNVIIEKNDQSDKTEETKKTEKSEKLSSHSSNVPQGKNPERALPLAANSPNIIENLRGQFGNPAYSDIQILVGSQQSQNAQNFGPGSNYEVFYVHMPVLHLSPFMRQMIEAKAYGHNDGLRYMHVILGPSFNLVPAFSMALQYLYTTPLIRSENLWEVVLSSANHGLVYGKTIGDFQPGIAMVHFSLCYAVSGLFFNLPEVTKRGMELAHGLLAWNTVELFLRFGMEPSAYMMTCPELCDEMIASPTPNSGNTGGMWSPKISMSHMKEFNEKWPGMTTNIALQFIANAITPDFAIYERAQSKFAPSRIPGPLWTLPNSQCSDPRLESLEFGGFLSYAETAPTDPAVLVPSAMLLTLPFSAFSKLLIILNERGKARVDLVSEVVRLREARRLQAVRQYQGQLWPPCTIHRPSLEELAYREFVMCGDRNANTSGKNPQTWVMRVWVGLSHPKMEALKRAYDEEMGKEKK